MTLLVTFLAVALIVDVAGLLVWAWSHGTLRTSDQALYDWTFESILRTATGGFQVRRPPRSLLVPFPV